MSRTKSYAMQPRTVTPNARQAAVRSPGRVLQHAQLSVKTQSTPEPALAPAASVAQERTNLTTTAVAGVLVPQGATTSQGALEMVGPGASLTAPAGSRVAGFIHPDGTAVQFSGAGGGIFLSAAVATREFAALLPAAQQMLNAGTRSVTPAAENPSPSDKSTTDLTKPLQVAPPVTPASLRGASPSPDRGPDARQIAPAEPDQSAAAQGKINSSQTDRSQPSSPVGKATKNGEPLTAVTDTAAAAVSSQPRPSGRADSPAKTEGGQRVEPSNKVEGEETGSGQSGVADHQLQGVTQQVQAVAEQQKAHPPAAAMSAAASAAAQGPPNEVAALAAGQQVAAMDQQEAKPFDRAQFLATLLSRIEAVTPQTLEEADEFKEAGKAGALKGDLTQQVGQSKAAAEGNIAATTTAEPSAAGIVAKTGSDLPSPPRPATPEVEAAAATPGPLPEQAVTLAAESQSLDVQMGGANLTRGQLEQSNEPRFQQAIVAKDTAQAHAQQAPLTYREAEKASLDAGKAENQAAVAQQLVGMVGTRRDTLSGVLEQQTAAKGKDEAQRAAVTQAIQEIYQQTKTDVETRLAKLDTDVNAAFDAAALTAQKAFEDHVSIRMTQFKDERYSGVSGAAQWLVDKLLGLPPEVDAFYSEGKQKYIAAMRAAMDGIATVVEIGLAEAKATIAAGKKRVDDFVLGQPTEVREIAKQAADEINDQFAQLAHGVDDKQNQIIDGLVTRYQSKLQELDDKIKALKSENGGLVAAAMAAVGGVIDAIRELKNLLLGALAKAAGAVELILADPIGFLGNLVAGVKSGVEGFLGNLGTYLQKGLLDWLFGALAQAGIQLPDKFDLSGLMSVVLQVLGLTWANIRQRAVAIVGENMVKSLETASEIFMTLATQGAAGLWDYLKEQAATLLEALKSSVETFVRDSVIVAGIKWLLGLLNPASAFVKACLAIYDIVTFIINRGQQILTFVNAVLDSVLSIAKGDIGPAAKAVEAALAKSIPVAIGFLASLLGIGDIGEKLKKVIASIQAPINTLIDWLIKKAVSLVRTVGKVLGIRKGKPSQAVPEDEDFELAAPVDMSGQHHEIVVRTVGGRITLGLASDNEREILGLIEAVESRTRADKDLSPETKQQRLGELKSLKVRTNQAIQRIKDVLEFHDSKPTTEQDHLLKDRDSRKLIIRKLLNDLIRQVNEYAKEFKCHDLVYEFEEDETDEETTLFWEMGNKFRGLLGEAVLGANRVGEFAKRMDRYEKGGIWESHKTMWGVSYTLSGYRSIGRRYVRHAAGFTREHIQENEPQTITVRRLIILMPAHLQSKEANKNIRKFVTELKRYGNAMNPPVEVIIEFRL